MVRPFRIGKHKVGQQEFDGEVLRLYKLGLTMGAIGERLRRDRTTVWRSLQRTQELQTPDQQQEAKTARQYYKETNDEFRKEPFIAKWIEDMKARRVGGWPSIVSHVKSVCDQLGIFPDQLDLEWCKKWLAKNSQVSLKVLRTRKISLRGFLKAQGVTDYELTLAGLDAKHYGVGEYKHVKMSEQQIAKADELLKAEMPEARFVFRFGIETCRPLEPIWNLRADQFYTLEAGGRTLYCVNVFRKKTEKSGAAYKTAYVSRDTYTMAKALGEKNAGPIMDSLDPSDIYPLLRRAYAAVGATNEYFSKKPIHALRHCGAQRLLEKTNFNRAVVAELGGWEAEKTLEDHYGGVPEDIVRGFASSLLGGE